MRILMLAQSYPPVIGGEERVVQDLSRQLVARGHSVAVATLSPGGDTGTDGVRVHRVGATAARRPRSTGGEDDNAGDQRPHSPPVPDPETVLGLRRILARERPDVIHAHNWIVHSLLPLRAHRAALVVSLHDYALVCATKRLFRHGAVCSGPGPLKCVACAGEQYGRAVGAVTAAGLRISAPLLRRAADMVIPISTAVRDGCGLVESAAVRVIPNFIAPLPPPPADPAPLPGGPFILFFGDASVDKGAAHLAAVHRSLSAPPPLVFAGRCLIEELRTQPGVTVTGPLPHALTIEAVRRSLFTVAPSLWAEPFGLVALESAAAGRPVVASATGGLRDIVRDGETGLLVAPGDATALRRALTLLIGDPDLRERLGAAARRHAATFSPEAIVPRFEDAYRDAIAARARSAATR